jgi:hypothetical protein
MFIHHQSMRAVRRIALWLVAAASTAGCRADRLLDVHTPDQIPTSVANTPVGAQALRVAAIGNFETFLGGDVGGEGVGLNVVSGLLADELISARGRDIDTRAQDATSFLSSSWMWVGQTQTQITRAIRAITAFPPTPAISSLSLGDELAELYALQGFTYTIAGEIYCNGIPIANADDEHPKTETLSNVDLFERAVSQFDTALVNAPSGPLADLAIVGKARALVDLGNYDQAALLVKNIPTAFVHDIAYSPNYSSIVNAAYDWLVATQSLGPADKEGENGLDFVSANDPRVPVMRDDSGNIIEQAGQDGTMVPILMLYPDAGSPVPLATGIEARLIEAEAAIQHSDASWLTILNDLRATMVTPALPPLTDPGTLEGRVNLLFRERAFWMYLTAHRAGDLRRLVRQYGRTPESVWPTGAYFKGGRYGAAQNLTPSQTEQNNPDWHQCTDRNP